MAVNRTPSDPRVLQDGTAPQVIPRHGYYLARGQQVQERAETLALLRAERRRLEQTHGIHRKVAASMN